MLCFEMWSASAEVFWVWFDHVPGLHPVWHVKTIKHEDGAAMFQTASIKLSRTT